MSNPIIDAYWVSDLFGKFIYLLLVFLSLGCWVLLLNKFRVLLKVGRLSERVLSFIDEDSADPLSLHPSSIGFGFEGPNPFVDLLKSLKFHTQVIIEKKQNLSEMDSRLNPADIDLIDAHLSMVKNQHMEYLGRYLFVFPTIVTLSPFIGLLGTVWGILLTLFNLQAHSGGGGMNDQVMSGLSTALGTTVIGLVVAIPALVGFNYLKHKINQMDHDLEDYCHILLTKVEMFHRY